VRSDLRCLLFSVLGACALALVLPRAEPAHAASYFKIASSSTGCNSVATPASAAIYQITNTGAQAAGTLAFFDNPSSCSSNPIWGPVQLAAGQTITFGQLGIPLMNGFSYQLSTPPATTIIVTW